MPVAAATDPVAHVVVDTGLAHLDRPFDYLVPETCDAEAVPGVRVRVRFAGRLVDGYLLERSAVSDSGKTLSFLDRVVSPEPVLAPEIADLCRAVADRYAGSLEDVLRLAVPPRHAATEAKPAAAADLPLPELPQHGWSRYQAGAAFVHAVSVTRPARAVWQALPGEDWPTRLAELAHTALAAGRGAVLIVPDAADVARLDAALLDVLGPGRHVSLSADLGPAERYKRFLAIRRGHVRVAVGTRAAAFAPVHELGLVAVFDDGDDSLAEPRAPYAHAREVLMLRSAAAHVPLLIGGFARTAEGQLLVESGWAKPVAGDRSAVRAAAPRIEAAGDDRATGADSAAAFARLSPAAFQAARASLAAGLPVLVQVPRRGYRPALACVSCRRPAHCRVCSGPLQLTTGQQVASCRWCGALATGWTCSVCAATAFRATAIGAGRTSEELGRAFPGVRVVTSTGEATVTDVPSEPLLVVAIPGVEPSTPGGYGAALLLDGAALLARPDLRAAEETLRRWMAAATLVRPAAAGGRVVVGADSSLATVQALIRWDPAGHAAMELAGRREFGFPPAVAMAAVDGSTEGVASFLDDLRLPDGAEVLGPVPVEHTGTHPAADDRAAERALVRIERGRGRELAGALRAARAARSARKDPDPARARMDPQSLL